MTTPQKLLMTRLGQRRSMSDIEATMNTIGVSLISMKITISRQVDNMQHQKDVLVLVNYIITRQYRAGDVQLHRWSWAVPACQTLHHVPVH